ncbi:phosphoribosyl-ATP diphosphatase [Candidatus Laterigemmans baculatus]|uniref:phosphoribosyl-ATP diphosphatase n=1 Tax=Candidatus Laterigemmans baculatus TaxID=2770505 RepID=UPI0013D9AB25|nr:phosphoribosyl-ATP diphosphatase [Candidatus Laterigemmans baculatus]
MSGSAEVLERLMATVEKRVAQLPDGSYTTKLVRGGVEAIGAKIREEAEEVVEAAAESDEAGRAHLVHEVADLLFHTMVMMAHRGIDWSDVAAELARREGVSGLEEKRRRGGVQ